VAEDDSAVPVPVVAGLKVLVGNDDNDIDSNMLVDAASVVSTSVLLRTVVTDSRDALVSRTVELTAAPTESVPADPTEVTTIRDELTKTDVWRITLVTVAGTVTGTGTGTVTGSGAGSETVTGAAETVTGSGGGTETVTGAGAGAETVTGAGAGAGCWVEAAAPFGQTPAFDIPNGPHIAWACDSAWD